MERYCIQKPEVWDQPVPEDRSVRCPHCDRLLKLRFRGRVVAGIRQTEWYIPAHLEK